MTSLQDQLMSVGIFAALLSIAHSISLSLRCASGSVKRLRHITHNSIAVEAPFHDMRDWRLQAFVTSGLGGTKWNATLFGAGSFSLQKRSPYPVNDIL